MPCFAWHLCQRGAILLPLSHLSSIYLLHYFFIFLAHYALPPLFQFAMYQVCQLKYKCYNLTVNIYSPLKTAKITSHSFWVLTCLYWIIQMSKIQCWFVDLFCQKLLWNILLSWLNRTLVFLWITKNDNSWSSYTIARFMNLCNIHHILT